MRRTVKIRIYPTEDQESQLAQVFGCARWLWNHNLNAINQTYKETGKGLSRFDMNSQLPALKEEYDWLADCYSQVLQSVNLNLSRAFVNFFERRARYPRFKSKHGKQSVQYPQNVVVEDDEIKVPRIGWVKAKVHRIFEGKLKTVTISKTPSGKYFASLLYETPEKTPDPSTDGDAVGIDLNLIYFAVTSDREKIKHPKHLKKRERNLKRKQKKLSRKQKGSKSRKKSKRKVAKCHEKIANCRKDFLHKLSRRIVNENQVICIEDLAVSNMVKNHCLAKAISDSGWSEFRRMLQYKAERAGKVLVVIDRFFASSKTCHKCLYQMESLPLNVRHWTCPSCKVVHDRDINAAINIRDEGLRILALGTRATAGGGEVRPKRGRKSSVGRPPEKPEA